MKIMIAYASAGGGHESAAQALFRAFRVRYPDAQCLLVDILKNENRFLRLLYTHGYTAMVKWMPWLWAFGFWVTYFRPLQPVTRAIEFALSYLNSSNYRKLLLAENPDILVSTHFFTSEMAAYLKKRGRISSQVVTVITDFMVHPFWISPGTDVYAVASEYTAGELRKEGADPAASVLVSGIPVREEFGRDYGHKKALAKYGLDPEAFTVLVATGSFGIGPIEKIVERLHGEVQFLVVCARNKKLYASLDRKNYPGVVTFGYVNNMPELMGCADVIITKPGGLSVAESLVCDLFPILISPIPGQETGNIEFLRKSGIGLYPASLQELKDAVISLKDSPEKLRDLRERIRKVKKANAAQNICSAFCQGSFRIAG